VSHCLRANLTEFGFIMPEGARRVKQTVQPMPEARHAFRVDHGHVVSLRSETRWVAHWPKTRSEKRLRRGSEPASPEVIDQRIDLFAVLRKQQKTGVDGLAIDGSHHGVAVFITGVAHEGEQPRKQGIENLL